MWGIKDLMERFGLSEKQVRSRLAALDTLVEGHCRTGKKNAILVDDYVVQLFDRVIQIEQQGITTQDAVNQVANELGRPQDTGEFLQGQTQEDTGQTDGNRWVEQFIGALQNQIEHLESDKAYLQQQVSQLLRQLEDRDEQLRALMPGPPQGSTPTVNGGRERMSRWAHLKAAILGR